MPTVITPNGWGDSAWSASVWGGNAGGVIVDGVDVSYQYEQPSVSLTFLAPSFAYDYQYTEPAGAIGLDVTGFEYSLEIGILSQWSNVDDSQTAVWTPINPSGLSRY